MIQSVLSFAQAAWCEVLEQSFLTLSFQDGARASIFGADNLSSLTWQMLIIGFSHILPGQETVSVIIKV